LLLHQFPGSLFLSAAYRVTTAKLKTHEVAMYWTRCYIPFTNDVHEWLKAHVDHLADQTVRKSQRQQNRRLEKQFMYYSIIRTATRS